MYIDEEIQQMKKDLEEVKKQNEIVVFYKNHIKKLNRKIFIKNLMICALVFTVLILVIYETI